MKDAIRGNPELTRKINQRLILNLVKKYGPVSRAELSTRSGLSAPTVSSIIDQLLSEHYIREIGLGSSQGGRRPVLITLDEHYYYLIGVNITPMKVSVALTNINFEILTRHESRIAAQIPSEELIERIHEGIEYLFNEYPIQRERILGIGISSPGQIIAKEGRVVASNTLPNWKNVPVTSLMEKKWGIPTYLEHNVKAMALRELWNGAGSLERNFIVMKIGYGIGAGIVINGQIFRGMTGNSGELGHIKIQQDGPVCRCGSTGCYESLADLFAIEQRMQERSADFLGNYEDVFLLAKQGDPLASEIIQQTAEYLARGMVNLIHLFNLPLILIGGEVVPYWSQLAPSVLSSLDELTLKNLRNTVEIQVLMSELDTEVQGAAAIVFDKEFRLSV